MDKITLPLILYRFILVAKWVVEKYPQEKEFAWDSIKRDITPELINTLEKLQKPVVVYATFSEIDNNPGPYEREYYKKIPVIKLLLEILIDEIPTDANLEIYNKSKGEK